MCRRRGEWVECNWRVEAICILNKLRLQQVFGGNGGGNSQRHAVRFLSLGYSAALFREDKGLEHD